MLEFENYRVFRDISINVNRLNNVDIHNQQLTYAAATQQLAMIAFLEKNNLVQKLSISQQQLLDIRKKYPEASFTRLAAYFSQQYRPITRSTVNH